tara:strand:- start:2977 stop:3888 length:912 start_codon:yes stop_codon:yes gene_type:complete
VNQNLSHENTNTVDPRTKFGLLIGFGIFVICVGISTILDYVKTPPQEPLSREIKAVENIIPDIMVDPLVIKPNMDISVSVDGNQKLLNWGDFRTQRRLNLSEPRGFRSVLQRRVEFDGESGFLQIVEFNGSLEALHFIWYLPSNIRGDQGVQYDDSFWTISGRFLQVSPMKAFSSSKDQMALHKSIANNLGKSLLNLTSLLKSETLSFEKLKWDEQYLGEALKLKIENQNLFLIGSDALSIFDSGAYKLRNYAVGNTRLLRVISTNSSRTLLAKSLQSHVLISTGFARNLDLAQKYELQRLFQ